MIAVRIHACNLVSEKLACTVIAKVDWGEVCKWCGDKFFNPVVNDMTGTLSTPNIR